MGPKNTASSAPFLKRGAFLLIFMMALFSSVSASGSNGYIITDSTVPGDYIDSSGTDSVRDFDDVPLWIKISVLSVLFCSSLCLTKLILFMGGTLKRRNPSPNRSTIMDFIQKNPGCTTTEIGRYAGINPGTVRYHLRVLEREREVVTLNTGHKFRYFQNKFEFGHEEMVFIAFCRNETAKDIVSIIGEKPGISHNFLSGMIGLDRSTVHWHMQRLTGSGIIRSEKAGKFTRYFVSGRYNECILRMSAEQAEDAVVAFPRSLI